MTAPEKSGTPSIGLHLVAGSDGPFRGEQGSGASSGEVWTGDGGDHSGSR